jgi:hypothetical protein
MIDASTNRTAAIVASLSGVAAIGTHARQVLAMVTFNRARFVPLQALTREQLLVAAMSDSDPPR